MLGKMMGAVKIVEKAAKPKAQIIVGGGDMIAEKFDDEFRVLLIVLEA